MRGLPNWDETAMYQFFQSMLIEFNVLSQTLRCIDCPKGILKIIPQNAPNFSRSVEEGDTLIFKIFDREGRPGILKKVEFMGTDPRSIFKECRIELLLDGEELFSIITGILASVLEVPPHSIKDSHHLVRDLKMGKKNSIAIRMQLNARFNLTLKTANGTVFEIYQYIEQKLLLSEE
ncbi:MAG: hypothetical protein P8P30_10360 [Rickettsiales bacterium]|nr:hypothetical protein [Rickettsiales bacterium]